MDLLIFIGSYFLMSVLVSVVFLGILFSSLFMINKLFKMTEEKWGSLLSSKSGQGAFLLLFVPYIITVLFMLPLSLFWFGFINFPNEWVGALSIFFLLMVVTVVKFAKVKGEIRTRFISMS
ncbi:hypothetical protein [Alkalihalobacillus pseudalcaliphilus]|uniref:hypothetical protein n=1 Tax=Alkalihalobacillus pseudalcaliphilus TaxID=79884 RepID=UPI00064D7EE4|nr:hypothetical protein [Alkalihalobacillus pseudalcaliphilus]KMK75282.1 hypothetical protein AB990_17865 [Alkalihalobacillus pseudalcaliphilus]